MSDIQRRLSAALQTLNRHASGSSSRVMRALILPQSPRLDMGEITDKGYINQRMVLSLRAEAVERLYDDNDTDVIFPLDSLKQLQGTLP